MLYRSATNAATVHVFWPSKHTRNYYCMIEHAAQGEPWGAFPPFIHLLACSSCTPGLHRTGPAASAARAFGVR